MSFVESSPTGGKASGLVDLPALWVPTFFTVSPTLFLAWRDKGKQRPSALRDIVADSERTALEKAIWRVRDGAQPCSLIVRSNALGETLRDRGALSSERADSTVDGVLVAAERVFAHAASGGTDLVPGLVVQRFRNRHIYGHLSNERRLSEELRHWFCEAWQEELNDVRRLRVERAIPANAQPLECQTRRQLFSMLRRVGAFFYRQGLRRHLEWVWDGARIWVVQCDAEAAPGGVSPRSVVRGVSSPPIDPNALSVFRPFVDTDAARWQKLDSVRTFRQCEVPTGNVFILEGPKTISALAAGGVPQGLAEDLQELTRSSLVMRTDIDGTVTLLGSRTDEVRDSASALSFLQRVSREFLANGVKAKALCFIAHRFIPALSCAFSLATPRSMRVRIDALWGLPDGLIFYPHDSFEVHGRVARIDKRVRYKPVFFASFPDGAWGQQQLAPPWDWLPSLDSGAIHEIAKLSGIVARKTGLTVQIMWLVGVAPESGLPSVVAWHGACCSRIRRLSCGRRLVPGFGVGLSRCEIQRTWRSSMGMVRCAQCMCSRTKPAFGMSASSLSWARRRAPEGFLSFLRGVR